MEFPTSYLDVDNVIEGERVVLAVGGGNDVSNGVLRSSTDHGKFTSWWARTTNLAGSSPAAVDPDCS